MLFKFLKFRIMQKLDEHGNTTNSFLEYWIWKNFETDYKVCIMAFPNFVWTAKESFHWFNRVIQLQTFKSIAFSKTSWLRFDKCGSSCQRKHIIGELPDCVKVLLPGSDDCHTWDSSPKKCAKRVPCWKMFKTLIHVFTYRKSIHIKQIYLKLTWCINKAV